MNKKLQNYINHIAFVIDASGSMHHLGQDVVKVFDAQIEYLRRRSKELDQETRVSVYLFDTTVNCLVFDMDCLRMPSLAGFYNVGGMTALIDATVEAVADMKELPQKHGDSSFLIYVLTDGEENQSRKYGPARLAQELGSLPDNWTVGIFVPDQRGVHECKRFGFPKNNISVWSTDSQGMSEVGTIVRQATDAFMTNRAQGIRGTKNLFELNTNVSAAQVKSNLQALQPSEYMMLPVHKDSVIKAFVESWTQKPYVVGSAYYMLTKPEKVQAYKQVVIQNQKDGKVYSGDQARTMLGLPNHEVKVAPAHLKGFDIFVQSTSTNRKLIGGTKMVVLL